MDSFLLKTLVFNEWHFYPTLRTTHETGGMKRPFGGQLLNEDTSFQLEFPTLSQILASAAAHESGRFMCSFLLETLVFDGEWDIHPPAQKGVLLPHTQHQHRTLHIQKDVLPYALC